MKKYFVILCMALMPWFTFISCSDDDDPEPEENLAEQVKGEYLLDVKVRQIIEEQPTDWYTLPGEVKMTVAPFENSKTTVTLDLAQVDYTGAIYDFQPFKIALQDDGAGVKFEQEVTFKVDRKDEVAVYDAVLTLKGTIKEGQILDLDVTGTIHDDKIEAQVETKGAANLAEQVIGEYTLTGEVWEVIEGQEPKKVSLNGMKMTVSEVEGSATKVSFDVEQIDYRGALYDFKPFEITLTGTEAEVTINQKDIEFKVERKDAGNEGEMDAKLSFTGTIKTGKILDLDVSGIIDDDTIQAEVETKGEDNLAEQVIGEYTLTGEVWEIIEGQEPQKVSVDGMKMNVTVVEGSTTKVVFDVEQIDYRGALYDFKPFEMTLSGTETEVVIDQKDIEFKVERKDAGNEGEMDAKLSFTGTIKTGKILDLDVSGIIDDDTIQAEVKTKPAE